MEVELALGQRSRDSDLVYNDSAVAWHQLKLTQLNAMQGLLKKLNLAPKVDFLHQPLNADDVKIAALNVSNRYQLTEDTSLVGNSLIGEHATPHGLSGVVTPHAEKDGVIMSRQIDLFRNSIDLKNASAIMSPVDDLERDNDTIADSTMKPIAAAGI